MILNVKVKTIILLALFLSLMNCSWAQKTFPRSEGDLPEWVNNPHRLYPEDQYIVGVGSGDTRQAAEDDAAGAIARVFKSDINVDRTLLENYLDENKGGQYQSSSSSEMLQRTNVKSKMRLKNVKFDKSYFSADEGVYYVLAYLDRRETALLYKKDILQNQKKLADYYQNFKDETNKLHKFAYINRALALSNLNRLLNEKYQILTGGGHVPATIDQSLLVKDRNNLLDHITVNLVPENSASPQIEDYLKEMIGRIGFKISDQPGDFTIKYSFLVKPTQLHRKRIVALNWKLTLDVIDNINQYSLKTINIQKRTAGISKEEARARIFRAAQKALKVKFLRQFNQYLAKI